MQLLIGLVVAAAVFVFLKLFGSSSSARAPFPPNLILPRTASGATAPPAGGPPTSPVPPGGGFIDTPNGTAFITDEQLTQQQVDNLAQYGTSWGAGQPPPWYTAQNLFGLGSTLVGGSSSTVLKSPTPAPAPPASSGPRSFGSRGGVF